jgi:hypothetical protein
VSKEKNAFAVHEEVHKEEAAVKLIGALKKRHGSRHLAVGRRCQPKKRTQGNGGSRKKLVAACRGMTRSSIPTRRKGHGHHKQEQNKVARGAHKRRTFGRRRRAKPEGITGIN